MRTLLGESLDVRRIKVLQHVMCAVERRLVMSGRRVPASVQRRPAENKENHQPKVAT
jgi:hypothetical protein